ncbi:cupin domain-containing protein [Syntrophomonas palmitatica]|uniref:cupin domain-containing protein n=1 Tax=Syntrophomonas palmitatica TaxID=402877 RepID=UPI0006D0E033|nr:cupin domain-containing protein [Syntrophomonas palmitatica]
MHNIYQLLADLPDEEIVEILAETDAVRIERIVSSGQVSPPGFWYDQPRDEWVLLLQGTAILEWENGRRRDLFPGEWLIIPAGEKHRVSETSTNPPCIWLAVHY